MEDKWLFRDKFIKIAIVITAVFFAVSMPVLLTYAGNKVVIVVDSEDTETFEETHENKPSAYTRRLLLDSLKTDKSSYSVVLPLPSAVKPGLVNVKCDYGKRTVKVTWSGGDDSFFDNNAPKGRLDCVKGIESEYDGTSTAFTFELDSLCECRVVSMNKGVCLNFVPIDREKETIVAIDPGLGGAQSGTKAGDVMEKDITFRVASKLCEAAVGKPYRVIMLRTGDYSMSSEDRLKAVNDIGADCYVGLRASVNADDVRIFGMSASYNGTYYRKGLSNVDFADTLLRSTCEHVLNMAEGIKDEPGDEMLKPMTVPATVLYLGYMSNSEELRLLNSDDYALMIAEGILEGLDRIYDESDIRYGK